MFRPDKDTRPPPGGSGRLDCRDPAVASRVRQCTGRPIGCQRGGYGRVTTPPPHWKSRLVPVLPQTQSDINHPVPLARLSLNHRETTARAADPPGDPPEVIPRSRHGNTTCGSQECRFQRMTAAQGLLIGIAAAGASRATGPAPPAPGPPRTPPAAPRRTRAGTGPPSAAPPARYPRRRAPPAHTRRIAIPPGPAAGDRAGQPGPARSLS